MKIEYMNTPAEMVSADWLIVGVWEGSGTIAGPKSLIELLGPRVAKLKETGDFEGKANETLAFLEPMGTSSQRVLFVGLGKPESLTSMILSKAAGTALRTITKKKYDSVCCAVLGEGNSLSSSKRTSAVISGLVIAEGGQDSFKAKKNRKPIERLILAISNDEAAKEEGEIIGDAVRWASEMVNLPPEEIFPSSFCGRVTNDATPLGLEIDVFEAKRLADEKMGCILGVGRGSRHEPRLLTMTYAGAPNDRRKLALVGKGITFDSGGLSIKTADGMTTMKCDMAGAATVAAVTMAVARLKLPVNVICVAPLAENMPAGSAIKPGDILRAKNGMTIEVLNTDAEGRLVLADALCHAVDSGATHIVDVATLTGACMVALGMQTAGVMTNDEAFSQEVLAAGREAGERLWPLPMFEEFDEQIRSGVADMKNTGGRWGGAITAAKLLENFVSKKPWVHVDIAGPAFVEKESAYQDAGGTGFLVRTLIELARKWSSSAPSNA